MGLKQKEGTRLIDDFSEFGHNVCTTSHEKLSWGIDDVVTLARAGGRPYRTRKVWCGSSSATARCGRLVCA